MQIIVDNKQRETKTHGSREFPILISNEVLSHYDNGEFLCHWHSEIEFTYIVKGSILYNVNGMEYCLECGDGLFCNANAAHSGRMQNRNDCFYLSITLHPRILYGFESSKIQFKYIEEIVKNPLFPAMVFKKNEENHRQILDDLKKIYEIQRDEKEINELHLLVLLLSIWMNLYDNYLKQPRCNEIPASAKEYERLKTILNYIHSHYSEKIYLENIAECVNICKSECCRFFKKHMHISLMEYLMKYKIEQSLYLLDDSDLNITDIATTVGFTSPSYYGQMFKKYIGYSPKDYRLRNI